MSDTLPDEVLKAIDDVCDACMARYATPESAAACRSLATADLQSAVTRAIGDAERRGWNGAAVVCRTVYNRLRGFEGDDIALSCERDILAEAEKVGKT